MIEQLVQLQRKARIYIERDGPFAGSEYFSALQNAELVKNAEEYYRALFRGRPNTWNLRDRHMFETLEKLADHLEAWLGREPRIVVWAHNSHSGNAAATDMAQRGEINIGQLVSEHYPEKVLRVGFCDQPWHGNGGYRLGWPGRNQNCSRAVTGQYEEIFTRLQKKSFYLDLRGTDPVADL